VKRTSIRISVVVLASGALAAGAAIAGGGDPGGPGPRDEARIELGRRLFFDPIASRSGARSCASCHDPEHGFSDPSVISDDDLGKTRRHSQTILDSAANPTAHWDGEFDSIEELVTARLGVPSGTKGARSHGAGVIEVPPTPVVGGATTPVEVTEGTSGDGRRGDGGGGGYGRTPDSSASPTPPPSSAVPTRPGHATPTTPGERDKDKDGAAAGAGGQGADGESDGEGDAKDEEEEKDGKDGDDAAAKDRKERRKKDKEKDSLHPPLDVTKLPPVAQVIEESGRYDEAFRQAFGSSQVTTARLAEAIAAYCRSVESTESPYDRYLAGDKSALGDSARRGLALFRGRAGCAQCHVTTGPRPALTDFEFHDNGVAWREFQDKAAKLDEDEALKFVDIGREGVSKALSDRRTFKTPTLRDVTRRGPYMHDGAFATLEEVVRYYAAGGTKDDPKQDRRIRRFDASDEDVQDLVCFLRALEGEVRPGLARAPWVVRGKETRLRFVDAKGRPLAGLEVDLVPEGDTLPGDVARTSAPLRLVTDTKGWVAYVPPLRTHGRIVLPDGLAPEGGPLVPDTCVEADIRVPVDGRTRLVVAFPEAVKAPDRLLAQHEGVMRLPGHDAPRTVFVLSGSMRAAGRDVAVYEAWLRTDVPPTVVLRLPGDGRPRPEHRLVLKPRKAARLDLGP
jgi:cytochrome c peroxidase